MSAAAGGGGAVASDEQRSFFFLLREGGIGLEATAAARFICARRADDDQLFAFDQTLGVNCGIATAHADGQQLGDFFGDGQEPRHGFKGTAAVIRVQTGDNDAFAEISELGANIYNLVAKELSLVDADNLGARRELSMISEALKTLSEGMPRPECDTISLAA